MCVRGRMTLGCVGVGGWKLGEMVTSVNICMEEREVVLGPGIFPQIPFSGHYIKGGVQA